MKLFPSPRKDSSRRLSALFLALGLTLILSVLIMFLMARRVTRSEERIVAKQVLIDGLRETLSTLKDAETGQRGFLLTGNDIYLEPYEAARRRLNTEMSRLATGELPGKGLEDFKRIVQAKFRELDETIQLTARGDKDRAMKLVQTNEGKKLMDSIRGMTAGFITSQSAELGRLRTQARHLREAEVFLFLVIAGLNLAALWWAYRRILHDIQEQALSTQAIAEQEELLRVTLASIGDGVIVTGLDTRITYLNEVAERLTGWRLAEARGRLCAEVFRIINETTRDFVRSPVEKVLERGMIVGLANHTLLIRRDGTELPIDDSGAPIRDLSQKVRGVVLVFRDFSDHKETEHKLRHAMEEAESANVAKDNFLATLSHELRTPLSPVQSALALWENDRALPEQLRLDLEMMRRNVDLEARLIDDLLDLTRIVRGKLYLNCEVANSEELVGAVATMYRSEIQSRGQELNLSLEAPHPYIFADSARLQQVLLNVLKNATKFTPEGGKIWLSLLNETGNLVAIKVQDNGMGMPAEMLDKLFLPFEQGAEAIVRRYGGLGLGMSISKALIEAQGGSITAESAGPGHGSTFIIRLPGIDAPSPSIQRAPPPPRAKGRHLRILLVEDHEDTSRMLSRLLKRWGHSVEVAASVAEGLRAIETSAFDLLLSDVGLPDGTGLDLIQHVRTSSQIPAVALTGYGMEDDIKKCKAAGFDEHLTKPINFQRLELIITKIEAALPHS